MLMFRTSPSENHFSVFTDSIKHIPGFATTIIHMRRNSYGPMDNNIQFFMDACLHLEASGARRGDTHDSFAR